MKHSQETNKYREWKNTRCPECNRVNIGWQENCLVCHAQLSLHNKQTQDRHRMRCGKCGATVNKGQKFCLQCGLKVEQPRDISACPACGSKTAGKQQFCIQCGKALKT